MPGSLWDRCVQQLECDLPEQHFNTWIRPLQAVEDQDVLKLLAPNRFVVDWVRQNFYKQIADNYGEARPNTPEWAITGKAMVMLGHYYSDGLPEAGISQNGNEARVMYTTAAMYFRDPDGHLVELATPGLWANYQEK